MSLHEIRHYVQRARREPTTENIQQMWRAVFLLKGWYFLPSRSDEGPAFPTATTIDGEPWLLAFTNVRRLEDTAEATDRLADDGSLPLLVLDPKESMERIIEVADAIAGVVFNIDSPASFRAPVQALRAYADHFGVPIDDGASQS